MSTKVYDSAYVSDAISLIQSVEGTPQSIEEREKLATDLAGLICKEAKNLFSNFTTKDNKFFINLLQDEDGKAFLTALVDQCCRSTSNKKIIDQVIFIIFQYGIPEKLPLFYRLRLYLIKLLGPSHPEFFGPFLTKTLNAILERGVHSADPQKLKQFIEVRKKENVQINIGHLGKPIIGENEAKQNLRRYLKALATPNIQYVSVKLSRLISHTHDLGLYSRKDILSHRLKEIYREAMKNETTFPNGKKRAKMVMLEMENYRYLSLTIDLFKEILDEPEFHSLFAGITLQAYLPESYTLLQELTQWTKSRINNGGTGIKICLVKGGFFGKEKVIASKKGWAGATFPTKVETDANFKKMLNFALVGENIRAVRIGIATHNAFDLAYSLLLASENNVKGYVDFEMFENRLVQYRHVMQKLCVNQFILYSPIVFGDEKHEVSSYIIQKFDDMRGPETFVSRAFLITENKSYWQEQEAAFINSCNSIDDLDHRPRRTQDRNLPITFKSRPKHFENEPLTDFSLKQNRNWAEQIIRKWQNINPPHIPFFIGAKECKENEEGEGLDPSKTNTIIYKYCIPKEKDLNEALDQASHAYPKWSSLSFLDRMNFMLKAAHIYQERRADFIGALMLDAGKILFEADIEVSDAIDSILYYCCRIHRILALKDLSWRSQGIVLVAPSRSFPCAVPTSSIVAALIAGNTVLFKPPPDAVLIGWKVVNALWDAGIPKEILQFIPCPDELMQNYLIKDKRLSAVYTKCQYHHAEKFTKAAPNLHVEATAPGKNAIIITSMADKNLAIRDLITSAFAHAGQKYSSTSLAILEEEVFYDPTFRKKLQDVAQSLHVDSVWEIHSDISPLIRPLDKDVAEKILRLEGNEEWLLKPKQNEENKNLWSPGIKWNVTKDSFTYNTTLLCPVLSVMKAKDLDEAISLVNQTQCGLVSGLHSLDPREHFWWLKKVRAGTYFINQKITDSIVRREPFGGVKKCSFGSGYKEGGPNFLFSLLTATQQELPKEKLPLNPKVNSLTSFIEKIDLTAEELGIWYASIANYAYWWNRLKHRRDPSKIIGQDNLFGYENRHDIHLRIYPDNSPLDILRILAAALTCESTLQISWDKNTTDNFNWNLLDSLFPIIDESEEAFLQKVRLGKMIKIRILHHPSKPLIQAASEAACYLIKGPVLANGRIELLKYLREITISFDYHRYGHLGLRELELRKPVH